MGQGAEVRDSADLRRILALPRRKLDLTAAREQARAWTRLLALAEGEHLRPWQGFSLTEVAENKGGYIVLSVGAGKTLLTWLIAVVLQSEAPLLVCPGGLRSKTYGDFRSFVGKWKAPSPPPRIVSFDEMTNVNNVDLLERMKPDLIIKDESQRQRNMDASIHKRMARYIYEHEPTVVELTATPARHSLMDFGPAMIWALGNRAPLPVSEKELKAWAAALDIKRKRNTLWMHLGALTKLCDAYGEPHTQTGARSALRQRFLETPGVVIVNGDSCKQPLNIKLVCAPEDKVIDGHYDTLRRKFITPDGWPLMQGEGDKKNILSYAMHANWLGSGCFMKWNPRPPEWWLDPRRDCAKFVRVCIQRSANTARPLDTVNAVLRAYPDAEEVRAWMAVRKEFTPNSETHWLSASVLQYCADWLRQGTGIVFSGITGFGEALADLAGVAYYGSGGLNATGVQIDKSPIGESAVSSWQSNLLGRNLQYHWHRALLVNPPQSALDLEQLIGRIHRSGQAHPVEITILCTSGDTFAAWDAAVAEARGNKGLLSIENKILRARVTRAKPKPTATNRNRWLLAA